MRRFQESSRAIRKDQLLAVEAVKGMARLDVGRQLRKGVPEIILAEGKESAAVGLIAKRMAQKTGRAIISRAGRSHLRAVRSALRNDFIVQYFSMPRMIIAKSRSYNRNPKSGGKIGILTAGTSDIPVAEEARLVANEMGCQTRTYNDVGVAGLHRLFEPLRDLLKWDADVILVVAGREGALPTVVAGIVDVPIIGVPTSRSYGFGEKGVATLAAMLQACSLGMSVVNIDGGVGAGAVAGLIANRVARAREETKREQRSRIHGS